MKPQPLPKAIRAKARALRPLAVAFVAIEAKAQLLRERVDAIGARILAEEVILINGLDKPGQRILKRKDYWLAADGPALQAYYAAMDRDCRAAGIKPADMADEYCPALVAEDEARKGGQAVIEAVAPLVGLNQKGVDCMLPDQRAEFLRLAMGLILEA